MPGGRNPAGLIFLLKIIISVLSMVRGQIFSAKCCFLLFKKVAGAGDQDGTFCPLTYERVDFFGYMQRKAILQKLWWLKIAPPIKSGGRVMTEKQQEEIKAMRQAGLGYKKIAAAMSLSENTVKSYCIRNKLKAGDGQMVCLECGQSITQPTGQKGKKFCSDTCRIKWWNHHTDLMKANAVCAHCGKPFHGRAGRKYCSHACYIAERFGDTHVS